MSACTAESSSTSFGLMLPMCMKMMHISCQFFWHMPISHLYTRCDSALSCRYLGSSGGKLLLLGLAVVALVRLGGKLTGRDKAAAAKSGAAWPTIDDADLTTRFRLKQPEENAANAPVRVS